MSCNMPRTGARFLGAAVALGLVSLWLASSALATFPGANGQIAVTSGRDGHAQIYVMNSDGSAQTNISRNPADDWGPAWSPDGTRIAFTRGPSDQGQIYVMNADGSGQTNISDSAANDWGPAWSPDGTRIAFTRGAEGHGQIYVMNADGSGQTNISNNAGNDREPAWSPDGTRIAFTTDRDRVPCPECYFGDQYTAEVYTMGVTGSSPARLTHNVWGDTTPAWSPDGRKLTIEAGHRFGSISKVMNADGSVLTWLVQSWKTWWYSTPAWSPNGAQIALEHYSLRPDSYGYPRISVIDFAVTGRRVDLNTEVDITGKATGAWGDGEPDWQPRLPIFEAQCIPGRIRGAWPGPGGWRNYGARFKSQADCLSYVRTGR